MIMTDAVTGPLSERTYMSNAQGREVVIVEAARTPVGRGHREKGYYKDTHPSTLLGSAYRAVVERAGIDPAEVENVLFQLPQVADAAIIGVPNERWGEVGMAIIVRKPDQPLDEGDVIRHCLGRLAKFKVPQSVTFVEFLPRNATGKVLKRELRTQFVGAKKPTIT